MRILLTNDDGVQAPGLAALARVLREVGEVFVVAPDRNRSGASNSLSLSNPLRIHSLENGFISVEGTPTDCVHLAITGLLSEKPDIVVSGINAGSNMGDDVWYSGTVAAAIEGRFLGIPGLAVSLNGSAKNYLTAANIAKKLVLKIRRDHLPADTILSVNVPDLPESEIKGYEITRLGKRHVAEPTVKQCDPRGHDIYWIGLPGPEQDAGVGTDFYAMNTDKVSITPLLLDLTHYKAFDQVSQWVESLKNQEAVQS